MSRARILADYVSSGDELALKAPLASPAFTGTPTGITAAHLEAGVLPSDVTGGSGLTALGTVATGNLSNTAIVYPTGHVLSTQVFHITDHGASGDYSHNNTSLTVVRDSTAFQTISGNTYYITATVRTYVVRTSGSPLSRRGYFAFYHGVEKNQGDQGLTGLNILCNSMMGNFLIGTSTAAAYAFAQQHQAGAFVASSTGTSYLTMATGVLDDGNLNIITTADASSPQFWIVHEYKGDVLTP